MEIIDLKKSFDDEIHKKLQKTITWILEHDTHRNKNNFVDIFQIVNDSDCFHLVLDEEKEIVGFSCLYGKIYPDEIARALNRTWYSPKIRESSVAWKSRRPSTKYLILKQTIIAKQKGYSAIFISMEFLKRRPAFQKMINDINEIHNENWEILPNMYFTCRTKKDGIYIGVNQSKSCWQNVALLKLDSNYQFNFPSISLDEWKEKFD